MEKNDLRQILGIVLVLLIAAGLAWAGSQGSVEAFGFPVFTLGVALAFIIQWLAFIPAWIFKTEKFYDLTGTITYLAVTIMALLLSGNVGPRAWLVAGLVAVGATGLVATAPCVAGLGGWVAGTAGLVCPPATGAVAAG